MNLNANLVSIVTPIYNSEKWVAGTIESVMRQSHSQWELLLVVDAGTRDRSAEIIRNFQQKDPRVKLIEVAGKGVSLSRNAGLKQAQGRYIAFLDSDDAWEPSKLETQLQFMKQHNAAISCTGYRRLMDGSGQTGRLILPPLAQDYKAMLRSNRIAFFTAMVDQSKTGPLQMLEHTQEDLVLWLELLRKGHICLGLQQDLGRYRISPTSRSMQTSRIGSRWRILRKIEQLSLPKAMFYFGVYVCYALLKRVIF